MSALGQATARLLVYISHLFVSPSHAPPLAATHCLTDTTVTTTATATATMSAVYDPLVPTLHLQAVEDKLRLHATSMQAPPSPPVSASDFIDNDSASTSSPSSPSTPTSATTATPLTLSTGRPERSSHSLPSRTLLTPTAKKLSTLVAPPSPAVRRIADSPSSSDERQAAHAVEQSLRTGSNSNDSLLPPAVGSPLLLHSIVSASPSPEPLPLPDDLIDDAATNASPSPSPIPTSSSTLPPLPIRSSYLEGSFESGQLKLIYKVFHTVCDLFFNVDKDLHNLTDKRQRNSTKQLETGVEALHSTSTNHRKSIPATVSPGYGELARRGFDKVLYYLCHEAPDISRMGEDCSFLDIGSGFGKCVLHAKVRGKVRESVGIEYIPVRHEKAAETLHLLRARFVPGVTDVYEQGSEQERRVHTLLESVDLSGVQLVQGDITDPKHHPLLYRASHIYMFDVVFSDHTMSKILPAIEQVNFALFACYHRPAYLERLGCTQFVCIHKMAMKTTGKQSFTCYFYVKAAAGAKVTRHTQRQWAEATNGRSAGDAASEEGTAEDDGTERAVTKKRKRKAKSMLFTVKKSKASSKQQSPSKQRVEQHKDDDERSEQMEDEEDDERTDEDDEEETEKEEEEVAKKSRRVRDRRVEKCARPSSKKRSSRVEMFEAPVVPVVLKKRREVTPAVAEVLARDVFNAAVIKAVAARIVIEAEREARLQRRYALGIMQALLSEQDRTMLAAETKQANVEDDDTSHPPLFERSSTLITDVHGMAGATGTTNSTAPSSLPTDSTLKKSLPTTAHTPSSLALLPLSPANVNEPSDSVNQQLLVQAPIVPVPSSSLCVVPTPSPTTTSAIATALLLPATPVKSANISAHSSITLLPQQPTTPVSKPPPDQPCAPSSPSSPTSPSASSRFICPYCSSCVRCVSECFQLPRHQLTKKQILAHGAQHAMPLLVRALPFTVQACIEAWEDNKGTSPRQLLQRMQYSTAREEAMDDGSESNSGSDDAQQPQVTAKSPPPPPALRTDAAIVAAAEVPPATATATTDSTGAGCEPSPATGTDASIGTAGDVLQKPSAASATSAPSPATNQPSEAAGKKVGAWKKPTGKTKNSKYVYAADRKKAVNHTADVHRIIADQARRLEQAGEKAVQPIAVSSGTAMKVREEAVLSEAAVAMEGAAQTTAVMDIDIITVEQPLVQ